MFWNWAVYMAKRNYMICQLRKLVIRNNVFRNNIEGEIMYNYKFDKEVLDVCEEHILSMHDDLPFEYLFKDLCNVLRSVPKDIEVIGILESFCKNFKPDMQIIKTSSIYKFVLDCAISREKQSEFDSRMALNNLKLSEVDFGLSILHGLYVKYVESGMIGSAVKVGNEVKVLQENRSSLVDDINILSSKIINDISNFVNDLKKFLEQIKKMHVTNLTKHSDSFNCNIFNFYKKYLLLNILLNHKEQIDYNDFLNWLCKKHANFLGDNNFEIIESVVSYVATNN